jgi:hypothetical protein
MRCLVTAGKHVNNIRAIARQPTIITIEELLGPVFFVGSAPGRISGIERVQLLVGRQFCTGMLEEGPERRKLKNLHC